MHSFECKSLSFSRMHTYPRVYYAFSSMTPKCVWCGSNKQFNSFCKQTILWSGISTNLLCYFFMLPHLQRLMQISFECKQNILRIFYIDQSVQKEPIRIYPCESNRPVWTCRNIAKCAHFQKSDLSLASPRIIVLNAGRTLEIMQPNPPIKKKKLAYIQNKPLSLQNLLLYLW